LNQLEPVDDELLQQRGATMNEERVPHVDVR
jgi:hypothetical protein